MRRTDINGIPGHEGFAIAIIVALLCGLSAMSATAWQASFPAPMSYPRAEPSPVAKKQGRIDSSPLVQRAVRVEAIKPQVATLSELVAAPWPCERIRKAVEQYGRDTVKNYARARGYTKKQIDEAMACVPEKRT